MSGRMHRLYGTESVSNPIMQVRGSSSLRVRLPGKWRPVIQEPGEYPSSACIPRVCTNPVNPMDRHLSNRFSKAILWKMDASLVLQSKTLFLLHAEADGHMPSIYRIEEVNSLLRKSSTGAYSPAICSLLTRGSGTRRPWKGSSEHMPETFPPWPRRPCCSRIAVNSA